MRSSLQFMSVVLLAFCCLATPQDAVAGDQKSILVTGASTGIGRHLGDRRRFSRERIIEAFDKELRGLLRIGKVR